MNAHNLGTRTIIEHFNKDGSKTYEKEIKKNNGDKNTIAITVFNKDGSVDKKFEQPMKSWLYNFLKFLFRAISQVSYPSNVVDMSGTGRTTTPGLQWDTGGVGGVDGIRLSTDNNAIDINTYALSGLITHGTGAGQLVHSGHTVSVPAKDDGVNYNIKVQRTFTNNSGGNVSINSCALMTNSSYDFLLAKDLIDKNGNAINITLSNGQSVTFTYNLWWDLADGWTRGIINALYNGFANIYAPTGTSGLFTLDIDGDSVWGNEYDSSVYGAMRMDGGVGATYGIRVGTGNSAITQDNYVPEGLIAHGTGAGQLEHGACTIVWVGAVGNTASFYVTRTFTNNSGGQIIIRNYGLVRYNYTSYNAFTDRRIMDVNKLTGDIVLDNGEAVTISHYYELVVA